MRFLFTMGRLTIFDFTLFEIRDLEPDPDVIVVHHHEEEDNEENDGPGDIFGSR